MIPFIPILNGLGLYQAFLNGKKDYRFYVIFNSISSFLSLITVFIVATFSQKVTMILLSFLISNSLIQIAGFFLTKYKYKIIEKEDAHDQFTYGKSISIMNILGGISLQIDKILIWHRFGPIDLAIYSIATAPPQQIRYLTKIIGALALPNFTTREVSALQKEMTRKALWLLLLGGSLTLFYILIAPPFFKIFFPKYQDAIIYSQIFSLIFFFFPAILFQTALTAKKQVRPLYIVQTIMPITKILLLFVMIPYFGLVGVFYTIFISELVRLVLVIFFFFRMSKL
jgi:O-antigen/teichoic acid export membrane protein